MSILSTNAKLIKVGQEYSAGSGISIDEGVISVTGEFGKTYSAGDNIDIYEQDDQLYISSKDWSEDIANASANAYNAATAQIPAPFDPSYISGKIDDKLDTTAFTAWQSGQYATDLQTVEGQINNKLDTSSFSNVSASFLTAINIPESATWNEVSQAYEQASGTYLTSVNIPESATWNDVSITVQTNSADWASHQDLSYISGVVDNKLDESAFADVSGTFLTAHQDISNKLDTTAFSTVSGDFLTAHQSLDGYATEALVEETSAAITGLIPTDYYPNTNPSGFISGIDLSDYYKKTETSSKQEISAAIAAIPLGDEEVNQAVHTNSATWNTVTNKLDTTSFSDVSGSFLTAHQDLSDYATTSQLESTSSFLSGAIDYVSAHGDNEEVTTLVQSNSGTWNSVSSKLDESVYASQSGNFLTAIPSEYVTDTELETVSGNIVNLIPDTSNFITNSSAEETYQTIDGMTAYQPTMSFAYNSSNEISSINNSAIACGELTGDYVSGKNVVSGGPHDITSATISGDVSVERVYDYGNYHIVDWKYSLSSIGDTLNSNSGDWNKIKNTQTLKTYNNKYEMFNHAYQPVLTDYTQDNVIDLTTADCTIMSNNIAKIKLTIESTASFLSGYDRYFYSNGNYWILESSGNGSAIYIHDESYPGLNYTTVYLRSHLTLVSAWYKKYDGVNLKEIAFKDDLTAISIPESATWNDVSTTVQTNSSTWDNVSNKLDTTAFSTVSGNFLTAVDLSPYATTNDLEQVSGDITALIPSTAGLASESYVQTNSAVLTGMIDAKQDTLTFGYDEQDRINSINNSAIAGGGGGGASYTSPSSTIWLSADKIESTDSAYIPTHPEDVLLTATTSWSPINGYATLDNTNKVFFTTEGGRASAFDNEGTFLNSTYQSIVSAETEYPPIKLYTFNWTNVKYSAYSAGIMDAYVVELARKNEVNSALNTKLDSSAFKGYYPSNNPSGFAKVSDVVMQYGVNLFDGRVVGINNQYLMGCDSACNYTLVGTSAATGTKTASAYVGTGHQGINIQISARVNEMCNVNWTAFSENGSNLSAGQLSINSTTPNRISGFTFNSPLAENISGVTLFGTNMNFTAYSAYTIDVKPLASQDNVTFLSGAVDYVSANAGSVTLPITGTDGDQDMTLDEYGLHIGIPEGGYNTTNASYGTYISMTQTDSDRTMSIGPGWIEIGDSTSTATFNAQSIRDLTSVSSTVNANSASWNDVSAKQDALTFAYTSGNSISSINNSALAADPIPFEIYTISGTGSVSAYEQNNVLWVSGKDFTGDISYISGAVGDVETLLASL